MRFIRTSAVVLLTLFWVLATNHCALEQVAELGFLACSADEGTHPDQDRSCEGDGCASVENQLYRAEEAQAPHIAPPFLFSPCVGSLRLVRSIPRSSIRIAQETAPPELSSLWRFSQRVALPPRAPSLRS